MLQRQRQNLKRAWDGYVRARQVPNLGGDVALSWERSSHLNPSRAHVPVEDPRETEREWRDSLLYRAAEPLLGDIKGAADESGYVVAICDGAGKLLWTYSSQHMLRRAEGLNFVPGGLLDETNAGTNALALALRTLKPTRVFSAEHYAEAFHDWVCYSAPIRDPKGGLPLGVLDFSSTWNNTNAMGLVTVTALARYIEERLVQLSPVRQPLPATQPGTLGGAPLSLKLFGTPQVCVRGEPLKLTLRQLEILALLALHPEGLSLDTLHTHLYGAQEVSFSTLKAEVSVLRGLLSGEIGSRPYRLTLAYEADCLRAQAHLGAGDVEAALGTYGGTLLPESDSPHLSEWRVYLDEAVRSAVLHHGDAELMWRYSTLQPDDFEVLLRLEGHLSPNDPRLALIKARVQFLRAELADG